MSMDVIKALWPDEVTKTLDERSCSLVSTSDEDRGTIIKVSVANKRVLPVDEAATALREKYGSRLTDSDLYCMIIMVETGSLEVVRDRDTRHVILVPSDEAELFLDKVFGLDSSDELV
jgi:hypothetical protein